VDENSSLRRHPLGVAVDGNHDLAQPGSSKCCSREGPFSITPSSRAIISAIDGLRAANRVLFAASPRLRIHSPSLFPGKRVSREMKSGSEPVSLGVRLYLVNGFAARGGYRRHRARRLMVDATAHTFGAYGNLRQQVAAATVPRRRRMARR
jgi:hypothetical protein